jgi:hypothetical protein
VTLIFNHSSTEKLSLNAFRKLKGKEPLNEEEIQNKSLFYSMDDEKDIQLKDKMEEKFGIYSEPKDYLPQRGVAVLVNLN